MERVRYVGSAVMVLRTPGEKVAATLIPVKDLVIEDMRIDPSPPSLAGWRPVPGSAKPPKKNKR